MTENKNIGLTDVFMLHLFMFYVLQKYQIKTLHGKVLKSDKIHDISLTERVHGIKFLTLTIEQKKTKKRKKNDTCNKRV